MRLAQVAVKMNGESVLNSIHHMLPKSVGRAQLRGGNLSFIANWASLSTAGYAP
jgi:hypothetical protein